MKYNDLQVTKPKAANRVGRGIAAGQGKTAGRGTKGQNARTGSSKKPGFEGGQNPLMQRLPKLRGFHSHAVPPEVVYTGQLDSLGATTITAETLAEAGFITNPYVRVKLIVKGELTKKVAVKLSGASATAIAAVQKAGGSFEATARLGRPITTTKNVNKTSDKISKSSKVS
ncbi:MAG TPA: 50S ribosomal protein L15 [Candidatus Saccharimonadales bacterium]|nr:50S ribosomal protein L15 [Candidatus Saccharimonadales bacterium]